MPILHRYKDRDGYYTLTSIGGAIITFQLTDDGVQRLLDAGVQSDRPFPRGLLLDLFRSGDAYTRGQGAGEKVRPYDLEQLEMDFSDDPDPESLFPRCSGCRSVEDLCLVVRVESPSASLMCGNCRREAALNLSIPQSVLTRGALRRILDQYATEGVDGSVEQLQAFLEAQFATTWEARATKGRPTAGELFKSDDELGLI